MKISIVILFLSSFFLQQENKLVGKFKMEYEKKYVSQNCIIEFNNNSL